MLAEEGVRLGIGGGLLLSATGVAVAVGLTGSGVVAAVLAVTAVLFRIVGRYGALLLAITGWALATGFGVNELGQLTFGAGDLVRLAGVVLGAVALGRGGSAAE